MPDIMPAGIRTDQPQLFIQKAVRIVEAGSFQGLSMNWRGGRVAEGNGLLNRHSVNKRYRGFESLSLRQQYHKSPAILPGFLRFCVDPS